MENLDETKIELTGNDFIDAFNLGREHGMSLKQKEVDNADSRYWEKYREVRKQEEEIARLNEKIDKLEKKVKKLRKKAAEA